MTGRLDQQCYTTIHLKGRIIITLSSLNKVSQEVCSLAKGITSESWNLASMLKFKWIFNQTEKARIKFSNTLSSNTNFIQQWNSDLSLETVLLSCSPYYAVTLCPYDSSLWLVSKSYGLFDLTERDGAQLELQTSSSRRSRYTSYIIDSFHLCYCSPHVSFIIERSFGSTFRLW